jgi:hypothetical protein
LSTLSRYYNPYPKGLVMFIILAEHPLTKKDGSPSKVSLYSVQGSQYAFKGDRGLAVGTHAVLVERVSPAATDPVTGKVYAARSEPWLTPVATPAAEPAEEGVG